MAKHRKLVAPWWKAAIAFLGPIGTALGVVAVDPDVVNVVPAGVLGGVVAAGAAITGAVAYLKRNQQTVDQIDLAIEKGDVSLSDLKDLYDKWDRTQVR